MTVKDIANSNSWWSGPEIFGTTEEEWPYKQISSTPTNKEKKSVAQEPVEDRNNVMMVTQDFEETGNW